MTCDKPCSSEQSHLQSTIRDGRFRKSQILTKPRRLFREDRSFGCLSIHSSPRRLATIPGVYFRPGHICFQNDAIRAKRGTSTIYKSFQTSFGRSEGTVYSSSHMARRYPSNLRFLFKLHSRSRHCYGPASEPRFSIKHGKVSPHSNSESHLPRYGDRFVNHDIFSSRREGFSNCSKGNNSKEQESGIGKGNLPVYRNMLSYSPCSKGSSNTLSTASAPSDNLTEKKFTFKKSMLLSEIHASPPCPARSGLVDTQSFHLNFKSNYASSSRHLHSDRRFRPWVGYLKPLRTSGMWTRSQFFWHIKQKGIDGNFSQSKVFPKIPGECPCSNNDRQLNKCVLSKPHGRDKISHCFKSGTRNLEMVPTKSYPHFSSTCCRSSEHFADPLSHFQLLSTEWMLCKRIFCQIVVVYGCPQIDLFASSQNHQLKTYCSWIADPKALKIDAFTFSWDFNLVYLFPPFPLIHKCLSKIRKDKCRAILIAPVWKSRPWYPIILGILMDCPALLPIRKDLLQLPLSNQTHPLLTDRKRNFKLATWPVSGNPSDSIKFLKACPKLSLHRGGRVQKSITSLPGVNSIAGVKNDQLIRFLVL